MKKRNRKYTPKKKYNPVVLSKKIEDLKDKIEKQKKQKDLVLKALENHFEYLTNFTSHDMKNSIQNLDSVIYNIDITNFTQEDIDTIEFCLKNIRLSLDEFNKLVPNSNKKEFVISELCKAIEIINKNSFNEKSISFKIDFDETDDTTVYQPFHTLLQVLNNLVLNAIKAIELSDSLIKEILIETKIIDKEVIIRIADSGVGIKDEDKKKVFNMYYTTTGGSGIGLYHAKVSLKEIKGFINITESFNNFTTVFTIKFPVKNEQ